MSRNLLLLGALVLVGVCLWWWWRPARTDGTAPLDAAGAPAQAAPRAPSTGGAAPLGPARGGRSDEELAQARRRHAEVAQQIHAAETQRAAGRPAGKRGDDDDPPLDADYIRTRVSELRPLLKECYEMALGRQPQLSGRLLIEFNIVGERDSGGLVDHADVVRADGGAGELKDDEMEQCVRATMESLTFPAPKADGRVVVRYPFVFASRPAADPAKQ